MSLSKQKGQNIRSDMALELVNGALDVDFSTEIKYTKIDVDEEMAKKINRASGVYITLETAIVKMGVSTRYNALAKALSSAIKELSKGKDSVLVVGLGNPNLTADALGSRVFNSLNVTRHLPDEFKKKVSLSALSPNVMGVTGIESFDIIKGVVDRTRPQLVIVVDSLASASVGRIASAFQICSSGITPGSGVNNHRMRLDKESLGVDVISVGVPLVVYASTIIAEASCNTSDLNDELRNLIVTPKDIDLLVEDCGKVISLAINNLYG